MSGGVIDMKQQPSGSLSFGISFCLLIFGFFCAMNLASLRSAEGSEQAVKEEKIIFYSYIVIDKSDFELRLMQGTEVKKVYPIAVGKNFGDKQQVGDMRTPIGTFKIDEIIDSRDWTHDFNDGKGEIAGAYGPWFLSLETPWIGIGIHGTHAPESIGTNVSEGCVRMHNSDLEELKREVTVGTVVVIRE